MASHQSTISPSASTVAQLPRRHGGRKPKLTPAQQDLVVRQLSDPTTNVTQLAEALGVHRSTIYRTNMRRAK